MKSIELRKLASSRPIRINESTKAEVSAWIVDVSWALKWCADEMDKCLNQEIPKQRDEDEDPVLYAVALDGLPNPDMVFHNYNGAKYACKKREDVMPLYKRPEATKNVLRCGIDKTLQQQIDDFLAEIAPSVNALLTTKV